MNEFEKYWNYALITMSTGSHITVSQIVFTVLVVIFGLVFTWYLQRLIGRKLIKAKVDPNVAQTVQRILFYSILVFLFITALGLLRIPVPRWLSSVVPWQLVWDLVPRTLLTI